MKVLICCETSGVMREAFRARGHDAWSCDLLPADDLSQHHYRCDMFDVISDEWDLIGMHPTCTYMNVAGIHWNNRGRGWEKTEQSIEQVRRLMAHKGAWYLENPISIISTRIRRPDQIIQPYEFGDDASKKTCLWLNKLPRLAIDSSCRKAGRIVEWPRGSGKTVERWSNQTDSGQNRLTPSGRRWKDRSKTHQGIASAMAETYTNHIFN